MRMRKPAILYCGLLLILVAGVLRMLMHASADHPKSVVSGSPPNHSTSSVGLTTPSLSPTNMSRTVPVEVSQDSVAKQYYAGVTTPISFWGKVVDETGRPVAAAQVTL